MGGLEEVERIEQDVESGGSLLEELKEERRRFDEENEHIDIPIPGFNGRLIARYDPVPWEETERVSKKARKDNAPGYTLRAAQDRLAKACVMFLVKESEETDPKPLHEAVPELGTEPVTYANPRLAEISGKEIPERSDGKPAGARQVMLALFPNEDSIMTHHAFFDERASHAAEQGDRDF